jgi:isopenicillin-N epimerase
VDLATGSPLGDWALDPEVVHLNHGSYGGCPRAVLAAAHATRERLEAAPMRFYVLDWQRELDAARTALASFVGADPERTVMVGSATTGVAIALASAELAAGDEIVVTAHTYRAVRNQLARVASTRGARIVTVPITLPFDPDAFTRAVLAAVTPRTRLVVLDHITSGSALRLPLEHVIPHLRHLRVPVLVDGAHAPGQIPLDVTALGATWYAGNNHKWLCAPKSSGFVVVAPDAPPIAPVVTSHGASPEYGPPNRLHAELDWPGTHDPAPHLAVPVAIATVAALGGGWPSVIARNHALVLELRRRVIDNLGGDARHLLAPDAAIGTMATIPITLPEPALTLTERLLRDGWEVPVIEHSGGPFIRVSAHLYNRADEADALARKLHDLGIGLRAP